MYSDILRCVLTQWEDYQSIPSDIPPEEYRELADALEGRSPDTAELVKYLRGRAH